MRRCKACTVESPPTNWTYKRGSCDQCQRERRKAYYRENIGQQRAEALTRYYANRPRAAENNRRWRKANKDGLSAKDRDRHLQANYGISATVYDEMLAVQGSCCAMCGKKAEDEQRSLCVDHDHKTGEVRGLLCSACNTGLGKLNDDPHLLDVGAAYLRHFR